MTLLLFVILRVSLSFAINPLGDCLWTGHPKSGQVQCNNKTYFYGEASCGGIVHYDLFCAEKNATQANFCKNDISEETMNCLLETIKKVGEKDVQPLIQSCRSDFNKTARKTVVKCLDKNYIFANISCGGDLFYGIFCDEQQDKTPQNCAEDTSDQTQACYNLMRTYLTKQQLLKKNTEPQRGAK